MQHPSRETSLFLFSHILMVLLVHFQPYSPHIFFLGIFSQPHVPRHVPGRWLSLCPTCQTLHMSLFMLILLF